MASFVQNCTAAVRRATGALPNLEPRRALVHPLLVSPLMIPREHSHTGLTIHCFCARVPALEFGPLIPTPPAVHRNLPGRPSTRLRHPRRAHRPRSRLMRRSTASLTPMNPRCAPPAPSFALRTPFPALVACWAATSARTSRNPCPFRCQSASWIPSAPYTTTRRHSHSSVRPSAL